ncbi:TetR/AcrR family transcriptional regulator [Pseudonocardia endophytica]|uniref:TetR family transcriptional regulator n=1 Tax=Pseudonocardia endophytica TaxID=401976 RepID=A0A4R1HSD1_PSEEN|nr:TetR family transcriptional regulator [Pseudonocardia endophytica]TCK25547.1 TetR family transcriptional regulator [Pseudonocardia endophytica]
MATTRASRSRRTDSLTRERIIAAAVELLDAQGESGLTFRVLTQRLATGAGAIYWHVANKEELLTAATESVLVAALAREVGGSPEEEIRAVALGLFEAIDDHPWLATQLSTELARNPRGTVAPRIFDAVGRRVRALGVPERGWFTASSALVHYVLGAAGQNVANAGAADPGIDRSAFLDSVSAEWEALDADDFPFASAVAGQMRDHDDREQFLAGVDLVLAGITTVHLSGE